MQILFPPSASAVAPLAIPAERSGNEGLSDGTLQVRPSYFGDTGYMQIFSHQDAGVGSASSPQLSLDPVLAVDVIPAALQESHLETYFEYGRIWCPVLDRETYDKIPEFQQSLLLKHALALCGNEINPSLIPHTSSSEHYNRAKGLIYGNWEANPLIRIISIMLFYWWSAGPTNIVSMDTTWWWTGIAVRLAQQVGLHREVSPGQALIPGETPGVRRRIWWSLVVSAQSCTNHVRGVTSDHNEHRRHGSESHLSLKDDLVSSTWQTATRGCQRLTTSRVHKNPASPPLLIGCLSVRS